MLYISRLIGQGTYGVVDTDDDVEEIVTYDKLREVAEQGIEIMGVQLSHHAMLNGVISIDCVNPYQNPATVTSLQIKTSVLLGVDIVIYNDAIVAVRRNEAICKDKTVIRLSDFASKCGDSVFINSQQYEKELLVIFDDKLELTDRTFRFAPIANVRLVLSECDKEDTIKFAYEEHMLRGQFVELDTFIVDDEDRMDYWRGVECLTVGKDPLGGEFRPRTVEMLSGFVQDKLETLVEYNWGSVTRVEWGTGIRQYVKKIAENTHFWGSSCQDFQEVCTHDRGMFQQIIALNIFNKYLPTYCLNYLFFLPPSKRIQDLYVELSFKFNRWALEFGRRRGWLNALYK